MAVSSVIGFSGISDALIQNGDTGTAKPYLRVTAIQ
jgi:hypothetical protein